MNYIVTNRYRGKALNGSEVNIPATTNVVETNKQILFDGKPICFITSQVGHQYFARNDDGNGMRRGALTYAIAYAERKRMNKDKTRRQRFTDEEIDTLCSKWSKFLQTECSVILFNHDFFNADISELEEMANDLHIRVG